MPDSAAMQAYIKEHIRFEPFCFYGEQFPACDFEHPQAVKDVIGPYALKTTFYNAAGRRVSKAGKPGRYGAVVEISHSGKTSRRFVTLCRLRGDVDAVSITSDHAALAQAGIDPQVIDARRSELVPPEAPAAAKDAHFYYGDRSLDAVSARLAAGLYDLTAMKLSSKPLPDDSLMSLDRQWWVDFKRRFYGYAKKYRRAFVCPAPVDGQPAATVRAGSLSDAGMKADTFATIDKAAEAWVAATGIGFGLCVVRHGVEVLNKGWGKDPAGEPFTKDTVAVLASTTKFLSAILLTEFAAQGLVGLDDPIDRYVAALDGAKVPRVPTVRDMYLHTAGFTGHIADTVNDVEEIVADLYPTLAVGAQHRYQGFGISLSGKIMEMLSGESIPRLFRRHLFGPMGLSIKSEQTGFGSFGTAGDLARVGQMMLNGGAYGDKRFTTPEVIRQILPIPGKDRFEPDKTIRWGIGSKLFDSDGLSEQAFGHSGASGSFLKIDPAHDMVLALARNDEGPNFLKQRAAMIGAVLSAIES